MESLPDDISGDSFMPIKALNTFTRDWVIKARVANKTMKPTQKGGHLLKIELVDAYGTCIEGTFFNDCAKQYEPQLEKNMIYCFSGGAVRMANKRWTNVNNDFCLTFDK